MRLPPYLESFAVPVSLENRRLAVVAALRAVAAEPLPEPDPDPEPVLSDVVEPVVEAVVDAVDSRLDELSGRIDELLSRLDSVETALLESAWEQPVSEPEVEPADDDICDPSVSVPAVDLGEGRMSSVAAKALFGH